MIEVRSAGPEDWEAWRGLRLRALAESPSAFGSTLERERRFTEADWRERLGGLSVLVLDDAEPVALGGGFRIGPGVVQVVAMWVEPAYRGRGLSRLLLDRIVAGARAEGRRLRLDVAQDNEVARAAYLAYGFVPTGETEPIRPGATELADLMELPDPG